MKSQQSKKSAPARETKGAKDAPRELLSAANYNIREEIVARPAKLTTEELRKLPMRRRLILAAIDEIEEVGFERFSVRRIANACGASCAAPYKHFKNKREFFEAILDYITDEWLERQERIRRQFESASLRTLLVELAVEYVRFMVENPRFRAILMIKDKTFDDEYLTVKAKISDFSKEVILKYCEEQGIETKVAVVKMYVVRSLIYGASLMFGNRELPYGELSMKYVRAVIDREFDLPGTLKFDEYSELDKALSNWV